MTPFRHLLVVSTAIVAFLCLSDARPLAAGEEKTVYDVLKENGLPMGLLPKGVKDFTVDEEGNFQVFLDYPCTAKFENEVRYDSNVTGTISYGQIESLKGISAQELFLWFPVKGIRVDVPSSGIIYFDVGVIFKQFSLSLFEIPPDCVVTVEKVGDGSEGEEIARIVGESKLKKHQNVLNALLSLKEEIL